MLVGWRPLLPTVACLLTVSVLPPTCKYKTAMYAATNAEYQATWRYLRDNSTAACASSVQDVPEELHQQKLTLSTNEQHFKLHIAFLIRDVLTLSLTASMHCIFPTQLLQTPTPVTADRFHFRNYVQASSNPHRNTLMHCQGYLLIRGWLLWCLFTLLGLSDILFILLPHNTPRTSCAWHDVRT